MTIDPVDPAPTERARRGRRHEEAFQALFEHAPDGVVVVDAWGTIVLANAQAERLFGYPRQDLIGRPVELLVPAGRAATHVQHRAAYARAPHPRLMGRAQPPLPPLRLEARRKDGSAFPCEISLSPVTVSAHVGQPGRPGWPWVAAAVRDTTAQHRLQAALGESEERYRRLAEHAPDVIYRYRLVPTPGHPRGYEYVSPAATAMTGYTPEEHYADPTLGARIVHPDDRPLLEQATQALQTVPPGKAGEPLPPVVLRKRRKDGTTIWTEQRNVPVYDGAGQLIALEGIARDITDRVVLEAAARERARLDGVLLAARTAAHELNNALAPVTGFAELLTLAPAVRDDARLRTFAERILDASQRATTIIADLRRVVRLEEIDHGHDLTTIDLPRSTAPAAPAAPIEGERPNPASGR